MLADIYEAMGDNAQLQNVLHDLISRIDNKLENEPESAYIYQKITVLKRLNDQKSLATVLSHFDDIPKNEYNIKRKAELKLEIENYLQYCVKNTERFKSIRKVWANLLGRQI